MAAAVEAEIQAGKSGGAAYEFVLAGTLDAKEEGIPIDRFFFNDGKYRGENRRGKPNRKDRERSEFIGRAK